MTVGYKAPIATFTGRFLDSTNTSEWFKPFRTARAYMVLVEPGIDRIYFQYGYGTAVAYSLSRFFTRLEGGEPLVFPVVPRPGDRGNNPELFLNWDDYFNPELSTWKTSNMDGGTRLTGFDVDDKGYVYVASTVYGWGVVKDSLGTGGKMQSMFQQQTQNPSKVAAIKGATKYYALLNVSSHSLWDVTDRKNPVEVHANIPRMSVYTKNAASNRIAIIDATAALSIYSADGLAASSAPLFSDSGYVLVTSDGTNFFGLKGQSISVIVPSGSGYAVQGTYSIGATMQVNNIHYGDGYLVLTGADGGGAWDVRLLKVGSNLIPTPVPLNGTPSNGAYPSYFHNYYSQPPAGYVAPNYINIVDGTVYRSPSGKLYLIVCGKGIGDVYELADGDSLNVTNDGHTGQTNPNTPVASNSKTFYGDPVQFTARTQSTTIATVAWNMGNPEAGGLANQPTSAPNQSIVYKYSNLSRSGVGTRSVTASNISDANVRGTASVTLESPVARFGIAGATAKYLFTQPNASSAAPIVVGDSFVDASDGTIESHYTSWNIDGVPTRALPNAPMSAGACGVHSLIFTGAYGPYSSPATGTSNFIVGLDASNGAFNYTVSPFAAAVELAGSNASSLTFRSAARGVTSALVNAASGFTWKWELVGSSGVLLSATGSGPTVDDFVVPKQTLISQQNARARLTLQTKGNFTGSCAGLETTVALSNPISTPDPQITQTGNCQGTPCTFSATSISGIDTAADNWTYQWSVTPTGSIDATMLTGSTLSTSFLKTGSYTVSVTATNAVGANAASTSVVINTAASPCSPLTNNSFVATFNGAQGCSPYQGCAAGESVSFQVTSPLGSGYDPNCTPNHTYTWSFPDGTGSGQYVTKNVTVGGTVSVVVNNGKESHTYSTTLTMASGGGGGGGGGNPCGTMTATNIQPTWSGSTCPSGGTTCGTNDLLTFDVQPYLYSFTCASHQFSWTFDGGGSAFTQRVQHTFTTSGTHAITLSVTNAYGGSVTKNFQVITTGGSTGGGGCVPMTNSSWVATFSGSAGCNQFVTCAVGESATFSASAPLQGGYDPNCAGHNFSWTFPDGGTATGNPAIHTVTASGTATVTISNTAESHSYSVPVQVGGTQGGCGPINPLSLSINYANGDGTCSALGGDCAPNDVVNFTITAYQYSLSCATHTFDWDFGDHSLHASTKDAPHQYAAEGVYTAKCVVNNGTQSVTLSQSVSVKGNSPIGSAVTAAFAVVPLQGVPNGYLFSASFNPPDAVSRWTWDFGDNSGIVSRTGTVLPEPHVFPDDGTYTVTLTAYDAQGHAVGTYNHKNDAESKRRSVRH